MVEEMWPRYGSFPGFHPIVELSLTNHHQVVGANGQRQAMFLENVPGLAERILRNFQTDPRDCALLVSSSGCNVVPIEIAQIFRERGIKVVSIVSQEHARSVRAGTHQDTSFRIFLIACWIPVHLSGTPWFRWKALQRLSHLGGRLAVACWSMPSKRPLLKN